MCALYTLQSLPCPENNSCTTNKKRFYKPEEQIYILMIPIFQHSLESFARKQYLLLKSHLLFNKTDINQLLHFPSPKQEVNHWNPKGKAFIICFRGICLRLAQLTLNSLSETIDKQLCIPLWSYDFQYTNFAEFHMSRVNSFQALLLMIWTSKSFQSDFFIGSYTAPRVYPHASSKY